MQFTEYYAFLKSIFKPDSGINLIPGTNTEIRFCLFESPAEISAETDLLHEMRKKIEGGEEDQMILENHAFYYPVFLPASEAKQQSAILLLHGLNERKWDKYLTWAQSLVEQTGKAVILFPTSFHINRSPIRWLDPRQLSVKVEERKRKYIELQESTFANLTLSERLTESPERFFLSGLETANDITSLMQEIQTGTHPLFAENTRVDIFAYSIGGLLAQVLKMANPHNLYADSKLFLFCAGSVFESMNGVSRVIMDSEANERIHRYYETEIEEEISKPGILHSAFHESKIARAFHSMIGFARFSVERERLFEGFSHQVRAIALRDDKVIPALEIEKTLNPGNITRSEIEILHFDYPYVHEMPFPVKIAGIEKKVNEAFSLIFGKAAAFLA